MSAFLRCAAAAVAFLGLAGQAHAVAITRSFTASWYDPTHAGHGFNIEVVDNAAGKTMVMYWYTFDANGAPLWVLGQGPVDGERATLQAVTTTGGRFGNAFDPGSIQVRNWGTLGVEFSDCNNGIVRWQPADPALTAGAMPIARLTQLFGSSCSGGISDDASSTAATGTASETFLTNTGVAPAARARARFEQRADRTDFKVELEDLPAGSYALNVAGVQRASIAVTARLGGTQGEIEFRSPVEPGKVLLDFDPRGKTITVTQGSVTYFSSTLGSGTPIVTPPVGGTPPPTGNAVHALRVEPQGNDGPELYAELEQRSDRVEFKVEVEDVPTGAYTIRVGGTERGTVNVVAVAGGTNGELEYRNPVEPGKVLLDFDPRGALIEIVRNGTVVLSGTLPAQPTGTPESGGGGSDDDGTPSTGTLITASLVSSGVDGDANGHVEYEYSSNERELEVEIEDVPDGSYVLTVGGTQRAVIGVVDERGEVKFNNPPRAGRLLLDFDPRGQRVEITRSGVLYLSVDFPG